MKIKLYSFLIVFMSFWSQSSQAQDPNWSVNAANYQYSMTFTAFLNVDGVTLTSQNDKVAAFVNGEIRGVSNVVHVASVNKYVVYLTVYANKDKETVNFKIYNSATQSVVNINKTVVFSIDSHLGSISQSYSIASPELNENAILNSFSFTGITPVSIDISSDKVTIVLPENTSLTALKPIFEASANSKVFVNDVLQTSGISIQNFTTVITFKIISENEAVINEYKVVVSVASSANPTTVVISTIDKLNTNSVPVSLDIVFSKDVSGFDISDFELENAVLNSFSKIDNQNYKVDVIPILQGDFSVQIPGNIALDINNNQNEISNKIEFTFDIAKPVITKILAGKDTNFWFEVVFSEGVLNVDIADFELKGAAIKDLELSNLSKISDSIFRVDVSNSNSDLGVISLQLKNTNDIKDNAENAVVLLDYDAYFVGNVSVSKKEITITADAKTKIYGEIDPELTYTITSGTLETGDVLTGELSREIGENVGEYAISSTLENDKYEITFIAANLSITKKEITISADAKTKLVGTTDPELTYTITSGTLETGDVLTGELTREAGETVGSYAILSTLNNANYNITFISADLIITSKKRLIITADAKTKIYGATDPELTYTITSGTLETGDVLTGELTREVGENVGEYAISSTLENDNYEITFIPANLSITKKEITISADAKTKDFGDDDPELTYTITFGTLETSDVLTGELTREEGEAIDVYVISSTLENNNYTITFVPNNFTITTRKITVTADVITKRKGSADPDLTYKITQGSLLDNDVLTGDLVREVGEEVGVYVIRKGTLTVADTYSMTFVTAGFFIEEKLIVDEIEIKLFPNPIENFFMIEATEGVNVEEVVIYSLLGKVIVKEKNTTEIIQLGELSSGVYLVKVITDQGTKIKRLIKK